MDHSVAAALFVRQFFIGEDAVASDEQSIYW